MRDSSKEAFNGFNASGKKETHQREILRALKETGNSTCRSISNNSFLTYHEVQRRTSELEFKGLIKVVGREHTIKNRPLIWGLV